MFVLGTKDREPALFAFEKGLTYDVHSAKFFQSVAGAKAWLATVPPYKTVLHVWEVEVNLVEVK